MPNGFGRGFGFGRGRRFGFRGSSPPWPYVGRGRGGLPRGAYFMGGVGMPPAWDYPQPQYMGPQYIGEPSAPGYAPFSPQMTREEELSYLQDQAKGITEQLDGIETRMRDLEKEKE